MKLFTKRSIYKVLPVLLAVFFFTTKSHATTAILLTDEQLVTSSRVILTGEVQAVKAAFDANQGNIYTYVKIQVAGVLKGHLQNQQIVFKQLGGTVGDHSTVIFGAPDYQIGDQVLLFLDTASDGTLRIAHLFQGKYDIAYDASQDRHIVKRDLDGGTINLLGVTASPEITNQASLAKFNKRIRKLLNSHALEVQSYDEKYAPTPIVEIPPEYVDDPPGSINPQYTFLGSGYRWTEPDSNQPVVYRVNPTGAPTPGGGNTEINQALAAWTNVQTTALVLQNGGSTTSGGFKADGVTAISFNDPNNQITDPVGCAGILAIGGVSSAGGPSTVIGGKSFYKIYEGDVVFNNGFSCFLGKSANLAEVACHEIGHTLGFGHSTDTAAIMYASAHGNGRGATLGTDDVAVVTFLYPGSKSGGTPSAPSAPTGLSAAASGNTSINLSWLDTSTNEQGFRLERKLGSGGTYAQIADLPANQNTFADSGLQSSSTYFYRVRAYNAVGVSGYSNEAFATTAAAAPAADNAAFVSQVVSSSMSPGQAVGVSVTMQNTGTTTWTANSVYKLGSQNPQDNTTWGLNRVNLTASVAPGASVTFSFTVTAPVNAGNYNFQWRMIKEGTAYFGSASTNVVVNVAASGTPVSITTTFLPSATRGQLYSQQLAATGGTPPYVWSVSSGTLPPGLTLSSGGLLRGIPTVGGTYYFTLTARDQNSRTASMSFKMAVR
ncbi:MAG: matrixin family metalloprotease [Acidobacteria bacterium]|nr:matrixin family metalloprotease [Acidobacteriota bacterium]